MEIDDDLKYLLENNEFDNNVTSIYKYAIKYGIPVRFVITDVDKSNNIVFRNTSDLTNVKNHVPEQIENNIQYIMGKNKAISTLDIAMFYYNGLVNYYNILKRYEEEEDEDNISPKLEQDLSIILKEINTISRKIDTNITGDMYFDYNNLESTYEFWLDSIKKEFSLDMNKLIKMLKVQQVLYDIDKRGEKLYVTKPILTSSILEYKCNFKETSVLVNDGFDIFNNAKASIYIPFIKYNSNNGKSYYKVYTGEKGGSGYNYNNITIPSNESDAKNTIYINAWLVENSEDYNDLTKIPKDTFFTYVFNLTTNNFIIEIPIGAKEKKKLVKDREVIISRINESFPELELLESKEVKIRGSFDIWNFQYDETVLLDMILMNPVFNVYLYIEESGQPYPVKKRLDLHYRSLFSDIEESSRELTDPYISNYASVSVNISQRKADKDIFIDNNKLKAHSLYLHVNIKQGSNMKMVEDFIKIFSLLMSYYKQEFTTIAEEYNKFNKELTFLSSYSKPSAVKGLSRNTDRLNRLAPEIFVEGYARFCQFQPDIIERSRMKEWQRAHPMIEGGERQVISFPKDTEQFLLGCPTDDRPYPGVKVNRKLSNKDTYPYLPCCYKKDHINNSKSYWNSYITGKAPVIIGAKGEKVITTNKILKPDIIAEISANITSVIKQHDERSVHIVRYGVPRSTNSLIHCVCLAIDDEWYEKETDKENYVRKIRGHIAKVIKPALFKQQMYDYKDEEIEDYIRNNNTFFDPKLVYRALEEIFNVNIYVFTTYIENSNTVSDMELPRFKNFFCKYYNDKRPTVVIHKTWGSEIDDLAYPQCELIVDIDVDNKSIVKLFGNELNQLCHNLITNMNHTITFEKDINMHSMLDSYDDLGVFAYDNIFYHINLLDIFGKIESQYIDEHGKTRAVNIRRGKKLISMITIPTAPENIPVDNNIFKADYKDITKILGEPNSITVNDDGQINALYYTLLDLPNGLCVYINPIEDNQTLQLNPYPNSIIADKSYNLTERMMKLKRTLNILIHIIRWLFTIVTKINPISALEFVTEYMFIDNYKGDTVDYYDLRKIPRKLPQFETMDEAIDFIQDLAPTLINRDKIKIYQKEFVQRLLKNLEDFEAGYGKKFPDMTIIENYYITGDDFDQISMNKIIYGKEEYEKWLSYVTKTYRQVYQLKDKINNMRDYFIKEPYFYQNNGKIYMIQNVESGKKEDALVVSDMWETSFVNKGYYNKNYENKVFKNYLVYGLTNQGEMTPFEDNTKGERYFKIIYYGVYNEYKNDILSNYAAVMELL